VRRAIIADDDPDHRRLLSSVVRRAGFDVTEAMDGDEVLSICRGEAGPPDVIVTDLMMPRRSGFAVIEEMRQRVPRVPVVVISAVGGDSMEDLAMNLGAVAMVHKPFDFGALRELVVRIVEQTERGD
jgi:DNA-binding response OmpR family regulator